MSVEPSAKVEPVIPTESLPRVEDGKPTLSLSPSRADRQRVLSERVKSLRMPEMGAPRRSRASWLPWLLCAILLTALFWRGGLALNSPQANPDDETDTADAGNAASSGKPQSAGTLNASSVAGAESGRSVVLESKGYIIAAHQILVSPKVSGTVTRLTFEEGKRVKKGDVLAEIEDVDYRTDYAHACGECETARHKLLELEHGNRPEEIDQARAQLQESEANLITLEADWKRIQQLRQAKVATPADYDASMSRYQAMTRQIDRMRFAYKLMLAGSRKEKIDQAKADLQTATSNVDKARWKLDNCKIRSPITGTILRKNAEEGNLVNPIAFSGSVSLCELADLSDLEVDLTVQERDVSNVFKNQRCVVRSEAYPDRVYKGVVSRLMPIADRAKGAIPIRVKLTVPREEEGVYLKPEMGAVVTFYAAEPAPKPSAPTPVKSGK
ncbi:MAG TPA: efflux RND transporter periplasmic adaptor subunit [Planctomycetaceae bacterium]|nr:efflux RND transporter periplasmic adaptor subunit [Planctomycetaceae bacterium]